MSDERPNTSPRESSAPAGTLRPAGKRQVAGLTPQVGGATGTAATPVRVTETKPARRNPISGTGNYFAGVFRELSKVIWPTGREMVTYTVVVLVFLALMTALVAGVDYLTNMGLRAIFNP